MIKRILICCIHLFLAIFFFSVLSYANILVISPHPDDDILIAAGIIYKAVQRGEPVKIVHITNGDFRGTQQGLIRQAEAVNAAVRLGMNEDDLIFLGYPDGYLKEIFQNYTGQYDQFTTPYGQSTTYGNRGLGRRDYHSYRFGVPALYNRYNILVDLQDIISFFAPDHIFTTSKFDTHYDHLTTYKLLELALPTIFENLANYFPQVHSTIIHAPGVNWPAPMDATSYFTEIPNLSQTGLIWANRESIDVPLSMQGIDYALNPKYKAINEHKSQYGASGFLGKFIHKDEIFWVENLRGSNRPPKVNAGYDQTAAEGMVVYLDGSGSSDPDGTPLSFQWVQTSGIPVQLSNANTAHPTFTAPTGLVMDEVLTFQLVVSDGQFTSIPDSVTITVLASQPTYYNIAPLATVTASSEYVSRGSLAIKAVDGIVDGFPPPGDYTREWATLGQRVGAWICLVWNVPYAVDRVILYDRPNIIDQILSATLSFSDGTTVQVGPLNNEGYGVEYVFAPRVITSLMLTVTGVSSTTGSVGLAEIEVFGSPSQIGNRLPLANAGPDQTVGEGAVVYLDGSGSSDPDGDPLTFQWVQTAGTTVQLSNPTIPNPSFTAPTGLMQDQVLTFQLVVNDGRLNSAPDSVNITVRASNHPPLANAGGDQIVGEGVVVYLDGSGSSDPDGNPLTFQWVQTAGTTVQLSNPAISSPTFTAPTGLIQDQVLTFQLVVNDGQLNSAPDSVNITVRASGAGGGDCPTGAYLSYWDGDHTSGTNYICTNGGINIKNGNQNGTIEIGTTYGQDSTVGVRINSVNESLSWAISGRDLLNEETGTMWFSVYFPNSSRAGAAQFIEANSGNSANFLYALSLVNGRVIFGYRGYSTGAVDVVSGINDRVSTRTWTRVGCSWDRPNSRLSVKVGNGPWTEIVRTLVQWSAPASELHIGEESSQSPLADIYYIDDVIVFSDYQASDPGLF